MKDASDRLDNPPIIEAILDIDCELRPDFRVLEVEGLAEAAFKDQYPKKTRQFVQSHQIRRDGDAPPTVESGLPDVQSVRFHSEDDRQLVQVRSTGYSFNRLRPYSTFDDYLDEIQRTWSTYSDLVSPLGIIELRLRYINQIPVPLINGRAELEDYFEVGPSVPEKSRFILANFLNQFAAFDRKNEVFVNFVLAAQQPEDGVLPVIMDITVKSTARIATDDWASFLSVVEKMRDSKNTVFWKSLSKKCLNQFQQPH